MDHALVLIGASAGGVEAVRDVVTALPADLDASVPVVVHITANATSTLPEILSRSGALPAAHAQDGDDLEPGRILVAPPDHHLVVGSSNVRLTRDPKESVGHAWSEQAMHDGQSDDVEEALWTAVRTLREKAAMADRLAERATDRGRTRAAGNHRQHAAEPRDNAEAIRGTVETLSGSTVAQEPAR